MTQEELNQALSDKVNLEMREFTEWLLLQPPEEILNHASEFVVKSDIVFAIDSIELEAEQARMLLQSASPLEDIYGVYSKRDSISMNNIYDCIESRTSDILLQNQNNAAAPVYPYGQDYAAEHREMEQYYESETLNIACRDAIRHAIAQYYKDNILGEEAVHQVVTQFGAARTQFVLANTIQYKDWDGRISRRNKAWANQVQILPDNNTYGTNMRLRYVIDSNAGLTDTFTNIFRREYCQEKQAQKVRPSVLGKLQNQPKNTSPKISAKFREPER